MPFAPYKGYRIQFLNMYLTKRKFKWLNRYMIVIVLEFRWSFWNAIWINLSWRCLHIVNKYGEAQIKMYTYAPGLFVWVHFSMLVLLIEPSRMLCLALVFCLEIEALDPFYFFIVLLFFSSPFMCLVQESQTNLKILVVYFVFTCRIQRIRPSLIVY